MKLLDEIYATMEEATAYRQNKLDLEESCQKLGSLMTSKPRALADKNIDVFTALESGEKEERSRQEQLREACSSYRKSVIDDKVDALLVAFDRETEEYNTVFEKKYSDYCKARADLAKKFADLLNGQREILEARESLTKLVQITRDNYDGKSALEDEIKKEERHAGLPTMKKISLLPVPADIVKMGQNVGYPDGVFFIVSGDMERCALFGVNSVALRRAACSRDYMRHGPDRNSFPPYNWYLNA